jgi:hypothetical protein
MFVILFANGGFRNTDQKHAHFAEKKTFLQP